MSADERSTSRRYRHRATARSPADLGPVRRIVTGLDDAGRAAIQSDGVPPRVYTLPENGPTIYEIWNTQQTPASIAATEGEPREECLRLAPPRNGTRIRVLDILPEGLDRASCDNMSVRAHLAEMGVAAEAVSGGEAGQRLLLANESIDYCIVLMGEMTLILDGTETVVRTGDIVVQRGTRHAWANRSGRLCRVAFVLVDARFEQALPRDGR